MDDAEIIKLVLAGDTDAFEAIVERHGDMVFRLAVRIAGDADEARDIVQEVFVKAYGALWKWRAHSALSTWLYRVAYNTAISQVRQRRTTLPVVDVAAETGDDDREERYTALEKAVGRLHPEERAMVEMFYVEEIAVKEIAGITGLSEANVKVRLHRIRKKLGDYMMEHDVGDED